MAWTEERVDLLKKLWTDGLSASQIANRLGGVTRNAVIGKVHRLGLSGRATTSRVKAVRPRKKVAPSANRVPRMRMYNQGNTALKPGFDGGSTQDVGYVEPIEELVIPLEERASIMSLKENMCRWPIGDPTEEDFHFCGRTKEAGSPYCEFHCKVAYQPAQKRRK